MERYELELHFTQPNGKPGKTLWTSELGDSPEDAAARYLASERGQFTDGWKVEVAWARLMAPKCETCGAYHFPAMKCPRIVNRSEGGKQKLYRDLPRGAYGRSELETTADTMASNLNWLETWTDDVRREFATAHLNKRQAALLADLYKFAERNWQSRRAFLHAQDRLRAWEKDDADAFADVPGY